MSLILTFLGKGGGGRTTIAIAAAKKMAAGGSRVLLVGQDSSPAWGLALNATPGPTATEIAPNLSIVQLQSSALLEKSWEDVKEQEKKYLRTPVLKNVYGQELGILPGMDSLLALNALREYDKNGKYDVIVFDGTGDLNTLRLFGVPEVGSWYFRRFRQVLADSDIVRALAPFIAPITAAILNMSWSPDDLTDNEASNLLEEGRKALGNPKRAIAYLVTDDKPASLAMAKYLWGGAQQVGLSVGGVIFNRSREVTADFSPLPAFNVPETEGIEDLIGALPDFLDAAEPPKPLTIDPVARQVKVYIPGFEKKQVKLTQSGPELTIEAGDQRRNIALSPPLAGQSVKGAKFQDGYLIISF